VLYRNIRLRVTGNQDNSGVEQKDFALDELWLAMHAC